MFNIVERYIQKMTKEDVNNFALSKNITLSSEELDFTYEFIGEILVLKIFLKLIRCFKNIFKNMLVIYKSF